MSTLAFGMGVSITLLYITSFIRKFFCVMGKGLSGELSCMRIGLFYDFCRFYGKCFVFCFGTGRIEDIDITFPILLAALTLHLIFTHLPLLCNTV